MNNLLLYENQQNSSEMRVSIIIVLIMCAQSAKRDRKRKSRRKIIQNDDATNRKILEEILNFLQDEPTSVADPIESCENYKNTCPIGYICNVIRARTCQNGECILKKTTVCELDCQMTICNEADKAIESQRMSFAAARGKIPTYHTTPRPTITLQPTAITLSHDSPTYSTPLTTTVISVTTPVTTTEITTLDTIQNDKQPPAAANDQYTESNPDDEDYDQITNPIDISIPVPQARRKARKKAH